MDLVSLVQISLAFLSMLFGTCVSVCGIRLDFKCDNFETYKSRFLEIQPFFTDSVRIYAQCCSLCTAIDKCASFNYDVKTHLCSLLSGASEEEQLTPSSSSVHGKLMKTRQGSKRACRTRPCKPDQVCVTTTSGNGYICLQGSTCSAAPPIEHMTSEIIGLTLTSGQANYTCDTGFQRIEGSGYSECTEDGNWTTPSLVCKVADCGAPTVIEGMEVVSYQETTYQSNVTYRCATGYNPNNSQETSKCEADGTWSPPRLTCTIVDCGSPPGSKVHDVSFVNTAYQSTAVYQCGLGYIPGNGTSVCQADGQWSETCQAIPNLVGTKILPASSVFSLECRDVMSQPVSSPYRKNKKGADIESAHCAADEILTGCSALHPDSGTRGSWIVSASGCSTRYNEGAQSVARCCKIPGLQCEYIWKDSGPVSCYKNFQLLDCVCWTGFSEGGCYSTMTNNTCSVLSSSSGLRNAVCCTYGNLICYVKEVLGSESPGSLEMTITCGSGETMTACSGFNTERGIQKALIEDRDGVDTCVILPGPESFSTLKGYVSCCKYKS